MNILFVNNFYNLFAKADCGASQRSMCLIRALAKIGHVDIISFVDDTVSNEPNVNVIFSQYIGMAEFKECRFDKFLKLFCRNNAFALYPKNKQKCDIIDQFVYQKQYDYIVTRYFHFACNCGLLKYKERLVIDIDDDPKDVILMSLDKVKTMRNKIYTRIYANTVDKVTRNVVRSVHAAFCSTPTKQYLNVMFLPNISAYNKMLPSADFSGIEKNVLVVGRYHYLPNAEGLEHFVRKVFPVVKEAVPEVTLHVVGRIIDDDLRKLCENTNGVEVFGFVEDLQTAYADCHCAIVPIYRGTGTSVKMVEAMAIGRAVVTTPSGVRGIHPQFLPDKDYVLADNDQAFAEGIVKLLADEKMNHLMVQSAYEKVQQYYSVKSFDSIVAKVVS